jgi:hypothetical protein
MLQFFQTRMGQEFYQGTALRLVRALETIASNMDDNLRDRVEVLELALSLPSMGIVKCKDSFSFVLGIAEPGTNLYYVSFPTRRDSLIEKYRDNPKSDEALSYSRVPATVVAQLIINHKGIEGA